MSLFDRQHVNSPSNSPLDGKETSQLAVPRYPAAPVTRNLLLSGLLLLIAGMCALPAGPSFNPGKPFQYLVALTLYLPALVLGFSFPRRWLELAQRPLMPWLLALFGWAALSLLWSNARRPADEFMRLLSVLLFLLAFLQGVGNDPLRQRRLLLWAAGILSLTAAASMVGFFIAPPSDDRLIGFGVMANANLVAAAMGAGILMLWPWRFEKGSRRLLKWVALAVMGSALILTYSRSAWIALFLTVFALLTIRRSKRAGQRLILLSVVAGGLAMAAYPELTERGMSFRPQIFAYAMDLFAQHPLRGWGLGANFIIPVEAGTGTHQIHTHNLFTQLAVELGLPGLLLWLVVWLGLGWRAWQHRELAVGRTTLGLWLFASIMLQFDLPHLIDSPRPGWLIIWLPLALSLSFPSKSSSKSNDP
ncbi:MAG TPA: O-antigen ligase family protein [Stenotrophomonas sp.]|jgi:O-antigen ligase